MTWQASPAAHLVLSPWIRLLHAVVHWTGSDYGMPYGQFAPYDLYSGILGLSVLGLLVHQVRLHNCRARWWCPRIGHSAGGRPVCRKHGQGG